MKVRDLKLAAIEAAQNSVCAYTKFIAPNDTCATGANQSGYYLHKDAWKLFFDTPFEKGENKDKFVDILWQEERTSHSRAIYYGAVKNEYRLTRFWRGFPYRSEDNVGNLLILCRAPDGRYRAFVLETDEDIDDFFSAFNISPAKVNGIIDKQDQPNLTKNELASCFGTFLSTLSVEFPDTDMMANQARECCKLSNVVTPDLAKKNPDLALLKWLEAEYNLFKLIENDRYRHRIEEPFGSVEDLIEIASSLINRRKSRAGKSLELHLAAVFRLFGLSFDTQQITEGTKKPDFIFPGSKAYRDKNFDDRQLVVLAAKTTCKDRWRQVIKEADRARVKYLFTLQESISKNQLKEMYDSQVCLIVPHNHLKSFPEEFRARILTLSQFIRLVQETQVPSK
jgi:hypothetical protein